MASLLSYQTQLLAWTSLLDL
nr:unnamed protein product [Callosobruchus chinensis]